MKTKFILILAILTHSIVAQNTFTCGTISSATAQSLSRAVACTNLINDFIPKSNDRVIEVAVNFWVFTTGTSSNSAAWTNGSHITTSVDAQHCIDIANSIYTNMPAPSIAIPGVASITNAKIKLILKNFDYVLDDNSYHDIGAAAAGTGNQIWRDKRAINILLGTVSNTYVATIGTNTIVGYAPYNGNIYTGDVPGIYPKNFIVFTSQFDTNNPNWDNIYGYGGVLAHEVGHFLGLNHTTYNLNNNFHEISEIKPSFGCCSYITAQDYAEDDGTWSPCPGPPYFGAGSNNIMSQNTACGYKYLSPEQVAIIHYNLRTDLRPILYAPSYNNAIIRDASFDYLVTSNETWTSDRYFKGNITVKSGNVLVIRCGLGMTDGSFIRVEKNAKLIIDGGRITNISGRMWKGIEVEGNPNLSRNIGANPNYIYLSPNQGIVEVKNNSKISQALNAIVTATSNSIGAFQSSSSSGGVVLISNSTFENNMRDIILFDSHLSNNPENLITGSSFITTTNNIDPLLTYTFNPLEHIKMYKFKSMQKIRGCSFKNTTPYTNNNIRG
ncbi:MAG: hypothetical protein WCR21_07385, partial [Bacteroidota bacterium]